MRTISLPELALVAGTRVVLGAGLGLLLGKRLADSERRAVGWTLVAIGALTTIPLAAEVLSPKRRPWERASTASVNPSPGPVFPE
jgi:hypothetical protein